MTYAPNMSLTLPSGAGWTQVSGGASINGRTITAVGAANNFNYALGAPVMSGKAYFEVYVQTNAAFAWAGVATAVGSANAFGLSTLTSDQRLCVAVDTTAKRIWTRINGGAWTSGDPATGAGGFDYSAWGAIYPAAQVGPGSAVVYAADQPMFPIPSGFTNLTQTQQYVSGVVKVQGTPQAGLTVRAYDAYTGVLLGATTTGTDGSYNIACGGSTMVFVTSHDLTMFDALIHDGVMTVGSPGSATPTGQMFVFNFLTGAWVVTSGFGVPAGGAAGQVLTKGTTTDGDVTWTTPAAPLAAAHRHWRVAVATTMGAAERVAISELRFLPNPSAPQTAPTGGVASSVNYTPYSTRVAANAFDGDPSTMWMPNTFSAFLPPADLAYDFGAGVTRDVQAVAITAQPDGAYGVANAPKDFDVQFSDDGAAWTTRWSVASAPWTTPGQTLVFANPSFSLPSLALDDLSDVSVAGATTGQILSKASGGWVASAPAVGVPTGGTTGQVLSKVSNTNGDVTWSTVTSGGGLPAGGAAGQVLTKNSSTDGDASWQTPSGGGGTTVGAKKYWRLTRMASASASIGIAEIAIHATVGGSTVTPTSATAFDSYDGTTLPANAIDTNASTFWAGATNDMCQFFQIYFATATVVAEIVLTARNDGWHTQCPSVFELLCSDDGVTFKSVGVFVTPTAYTSGSTQTFAIPLSY